MESKLQRSASEEEKLIGDYLKNMLKQIGTSEIIRILKTAKAKFHRQLPRKPIGTLRY